MENILLSPPIVFTILAIFIFAVSKGLSGLALRPKNRSEGSTKSYSCGEEVDSHLIQPDYGQFFPFAFFFTILHVITLMVTTVPIETMGSFSLALIYIAGTIVGLIIIFRR